MKGLTAKQKNIVNFIEEFTESVEMAPTIYEIADHFNIKTSTVFAHIRALQKKDVLTRSSKARSIALTGHKKKTRVPSSLRTIPVVNAVDGKKEVFCNSKIFESGDASQKELFALRVNGHDMSPFGILDGDFVIVRSNPEKVGEGDIVLTERDGRQALMACGKSEGDTLELYSGARDRKSVTGSKSSSGVKGVVIGLQRSI